METRVQCTVAHEPTCVKENPSARMARGVGDIRKLMAEYDSAATAVAAQQLGWENATATTLLALPPIATPPPLTAALALTTAAASAAAAAEAVKSLLSRLAAARGASTFAFVSTSALIGNDTSPGTHMIPSKAVKAPAV